MTTPSTTQPPPQPHYQGPTRTALERWLSAKQPQARVGQPGNPTHCALANHLHALNALFGITEVSIAYGSYTLLGPSAAHSGHLDEWAQEFVERFDDLLPHQATAAATLALLHAIDDAA